MGAVVCLRMPISMVLEDPRAAAAAAHPPTLMPTGSEGLLAAAVAAHPTTSMPPPLPAGPPTLPRLPPPLLLLPPPQLPLTPLLPPWPPLLPLPPLPSCQRRLFERGWRREMRVWASQAAVAGEVELETQVAQEGQEEERQVRVRTSRSIRKVLGEDRGDRGDRGDPWGRLGCEGEQEREV